MAYLRDLRADAAYDHPFWILLAHPFTRLPIGDVAFRATLWTSLWAAVAVALVYAVLRRLTSSGWAAAVGAATLMVSHTFWTHAVRAEVYSLSMALLAGSMVCLLLPWRSVALLLLGGCSPAWVGAVTVWRTRPVGLALLLIVGANVASTLNHDVADKFVFYLPTFLVMALWAGLGVERALGWVAERRGAPRRLLLPGLLVALLALPIAAYAAAPHVLPALGVTSDALSIREIPGRPALRFFLNPNRRGYTGAREVCEAALADLAPGAVLIADYTVWEPLLYLQRVEGLRRDVQVALVAPGR